MPLIHPLAFDFTWLQLLARHVLCLGIAWHQNFPAFVSHHPFGNSCLPALGLGRILASATVSLET
jgi:hypothetical protein